MEYLLPHGNNGIYTFYRDLFRCKDVLIDIEAIEMFLEPQGVNNIPKLNSEQKASMEGKITIEEMTKYIICIVCTLIVCKMY